MSADPYRNVLGDVVAERARQDIKWGQQNHPSVWPRLGNKFDIAAHHRIPTATRARLDCDARHADGTGSWLDIAVEELCEAAEVAKDDAACRAELVQLAAVVVAWIECIDRRRNEAG